jgi:hypothetical protein
MNTSLTSRFLAAIGVCLGLAQAAVAQDAIVAEPVSVWIFSDRYISSEHESSDLISMTGSNTASTISITTTPIVNIRMGSSKDVKNSARQAQEKRQGGRGSQSGVVPRSNGEDAQRPDATWSKDAHDKLQALK